MTPDQIANIGAHMRFERKFYEQQGSGLGLIIAKRLTDYTAEPSRLKAFQLSKPAFI